MFDREKMIEYLLKLRKFICNTILKEPYEDPWECIDKRKEQWRYFKYQIKYIIQQIVPDKTALSWIYIVWTIVIFIILNIIGFLIYNDFFQVDAIEIDLMDSWVSLSIIEENGVFKIVPIDNRIVEEDPFEVARKIIASEIESRQIIIEVNRRFYFDPVLKGAFIAVPPLRSEEELRVYELELVTEFKKNIEEAKKKKFLELQAKILSESKFEFIDYIYSCLDRVNENIGGIAAVMTKVYYNNLMPEVCSNKFYLNYFNSINMKKNLFNSLFEFNNRYFFVSIFFFFFFLIFLIHSLFSLYSVYIDYFQKTSNQNNSTRGFIPICLVLILIFFILFCIFHIFFKFYSIKLLWIMFL